MWVTQHVTCPDCSTESSITSDGREAVVKAHHSLWPVSDLGQPVYVAADGLVLVAECPAVVRDSDLPCGGRLEFDLDGAQFCEPDADTEPIDYGSETPC